MRAVVLERHGGPDVLRVSEVPEAALGEGQVQVRLEAIGVNYAEVLSRRGYYGWAPPLPYVLGMEGAGVIDAVGPGVAGRSPGERVIVGTKHGAYAELVVVPARQALPALSGFSMEENAAFGVNWLTAWVSLMEMARLRPGDSVLVTAAAGGVGTAAVQLASRLGCTVIAMAGGEVKLERTRALGAVAGIDYRQPGYEQKLKDAVGPAGVDVVLELVGGDVHRAVWPVLAPFGRVVVAGYASLRLQRWNPLTWWRTWRDLPRADVRWLGRGSHGLMATHLGYLLKDAPRLARVWEELGEFTARHQLRPIIDRVLPLAEVAEAHRLLESRGTIGKVLLRT